ncbi:MAG: hypothetical protein ACR2JH_02455 [Solirubrobacteraceae bacterium]
MSASGSASTSSAADARAPRTGCRIPIVWPDRRDPRLRLSAVIIALQILGQVGLGFKVSIAQILVSIGVAAAIDGAITWRRERVLAWPASALLTGNSVAFILRASGTRHGDWWSLHGVQYFILAVILSLASKHLIRIRGRHVFNPSNVGLLWTLLVIGPARVFPQYLWWGPLETPLILALIVILAGAGWVLGSVRRVTTALCFLAAFWALVGAFAAAGQSFIAIWHSGPVSGLAYWKDICLSPEIFVFVFFMMSDPRTAPSKRGEQLAYGAGTAALAAILLLPQPTEFGVKVAILASLTVTTALRRLAGAFSWHAELGAPGRGADRSPWSRGTDGSALLHRALLALREPAILAALLITIAAPTDTIALRGDRQIIYIERGLTGTRNPQ